MRAARAINPVLANETVSETDAASAALPVPSDVAETSLAGPSWVDLETAGSRGTKLTGGVGTAIGVSSSASAIAKARNP
jgi:hypothetical protein